MTGSKIKIRKNCEWCGEEFLAQKTTTRYCSHKCNSRAYKAASRENRVKKVEIQAAIQKSVDNIKNKEYLSVLEVSKLIGVTFQSVYKMIYAGHLKASKISSRLSFIKKSDVDAMFESNPYLKREKDIDLNITITEFYTTAEIKEKFNIGETWIFSIAKKHNIPKTFNKGKTYWSKTHIDKYFAKKAHDPEITEWYTVKEIQEKFNMTLNAIYTVASKDGIPKKKEGKTVYYSKKHFDIAKGIATQEEPQYYMVAEAMEKYNITRDQLYHYVKFHNIPRVKFGKYIKISKPELDKILGAPKIE